MPQDPVLDTITQFTAQLRDSWNAVHSSTISINFENILNIVVSGMGGSALGGHIVHALTADTLRIPIEVVSGYHVPFYVGSKTLTILSSYSGTTEETLASFEEATDKKASAFVMTTDGMLSEYAKKYNVPAYLFDPIHNPSKQPRLALGYSVGGLLALLVKGGFVSISHDEFNDALHKADNYASEFAPHANESENEAKKLTKALVGKIPILVSSEHSTGATHAFKNQLNETAKTFSAQFDLPEMNHHLLEGLAFPKDGREHLQFVFIESDLYSERVKRRYAITKDVLAKNEVSHVTYKLRSMDKLSQVFELLTFGSFVQYYLALENDAKMMEIPWVDYFKAEMQREH